MLLCSKAHPATITHEFKDSDVYRPCPADSVYYAIALVSSLTVKIPFSCPISLTRPAFYGGLFGIRIIIPFEIFKVYHFGA